MQAANELPDSLAVAQPTVLVLGATGQTGRLVVEELRRQPGQVHLRVAARKETDLARLRAAGLEAVYLDFDDARTFGPALAGVERLFLLTGYTVDMLVQSKTLVDAARKAGVRHLVHQGIFGQWDCTDAHFAWHQLVEAYIERSGLAWTHLHPNFFMEYFHLVPPIGGSFPSYWGDNRLGWIAARDVARVAATVLREGPAKHAGQHYWLSTEALTGGQVAAVMSDVVGRAVHCNVIADDQVAAALVAPLSQMEANYAAGAVDFMQQVRDGRMGYIGSVRDDVPLVTGQPALTMREWLTENRAPLLAAVERPAAEQQSGAKT